MISSLVNKQQAVTQISQKRGTLVIFTVWKMFSFCLYLDMMAKWAYLRLAPPWSA